MLNQLGAVNMFTQNKPPQFHRKSAPGLRALGRGPVLWGHWRSGRGGSVCRVTVIPS